MLVFVRDKDTGSLLPAPGFPRTLARGSDWRAFLARCMQEGRCTGLFPAQEESISVPATGIWISSDAAMVLIGGLPNERLLATALRILPLFSALVIGEHEISVAAAQAGVGADANAKAEVLTRWLGASRDKLRTALQSSGQARVALELQDEELRAASEELTRSQEAIEVANQNLIETNAALELSSAEAQLDRQRAEDANRAKSEFLATMSHELRTPLNAIGGYASLLEMGIGGEMSGLQMDYLARIKRSQEHLSTLISDVLNYAKVEAGKIELDLADIDLDAELGSIGSLIEPQAAARGVSYKFSPAAAGVQVRTDRDKVVQIVLNLLTNAVKFTPAGGRVELCSSSDGATARIQVSDTGQGIPADKLSSIFEPFVQLERRMDAEQPGVGLGLAISRDLAERMGGGIVVESAPGKGATFTLRLPIAQATEGGEVLNQYEASLAPGLEGN